MDKEVLARLNGINQEFYQTFADSFSRTRQRVQPGVTRVMESLPRIGNFLDIGCGNGNLARYWSQHNFEGSFIGVDFSAGLIEAARQNTDTRNPRQDFTFYLADLSREEWAAPLPDLTWQAAFFFAALHHIPSAASRLRLCARIRQLVSKGTAFWVSVWQPYNSLRLTKRILPWHLAGLEAEDVEQGDVLMDWRAHQPATDTPAIRFVHIFTEQELSRLARKAGFQVVESFYSDGREGNLALYQRWAADI